MTEQLRSDLPVTTEADVNPPSSVPVLKNVLIATISTFLSHYFNAGFIKHGWLTEYPPPKPGDVDPEVIARRLLEMKARFLYCMKVAIERLIDYGPDFEALNAYEPDRITERLEIISTPEHEFTDLLLGRCTEIMVTDVSAVTLSDNICGHFLRHVFRMIRRDLSEAEHIIFLYLFVIWTMPEVLFDKSVGETVRKREVQVILRDHRLPHDLLEALRIVRGGGIFNKADETPVEPVSEGWDVEVEQAPATPQKRSAWSRLFSRSQDKSAATLS